MSTWTETKPRTRPNAQHGSSGETAVRSRSRRRSSWQHRLLRAGQRAGIVLFMLAFGAACGAAAAVTPLPFGTWTAVVRCGLALAFVQIAWRIGERAVARMRRWRRG